MAGNKIAVGGGLNQPGIIAALQPFIAIRFTRGDDCYLLLHP
jgi:hypothetical protein